MLCRNCNYILSGKENFCPNCGTIPVNPSKVFPEIKKAAGENPAEEISEKIIPEHKKPSSEIRSVFAQEINSPDSYEQRGVFASDETVEEVIPQEIKSERSKKSSSKIFALLLILCILVVTTVGVADYFGVISAFSGITDRAGEEITTEPLSSFSHGETVIAPEINYPMTTAYVFSGNGYSPIYNLTDFAKVQIFGGSRANTNWLYVYCGENESYGWVDGSFLCSEEVARNELTTEYESEEDVPTAYYADGE